MIRSVASGWRTEFAFLPVECVNGGVVWLEWYSRKYVWEERRHRLTRRGVAAFKEEATNAK